jgi:hypothetical protein
MFYVSIGMLDDGKIDEIELKLYLGNTDLEYSHMAFWYLKSVLILWRYWPLYLSSQKDLLSRCVTVYYVFYTKFTQYPFTVSLLQY